MRCAVAEAFKPGLFVPFTFGVILHFDADPLSAKDMAQSNMALNRSAVIMRFCFFQLTGLYVIRLGRHGHTP